MWISEKNQVFLFFFAISF